MPSEYALTASARPLGADLPDASPGWADDLIGAGSPSLCSHTTWLTIATVLRRIPASCLAGRDLNPGRSPQPSGTDPRDILTEQLAYYIAGAREYDETAYGNDPDEADDRIAGVIEALKLSGDVLEIACGTGRWTAPIAARRGGCSPWMPRSRR